MSDKKADTIEIPAIITVKEFAEKLDKPASEVIKVLLQNGFIANINQTLDFETASLIAMEFDYKTELEKIKESDVNIIAPEQLAEILKQEKESGENLKERPPIVTILGHVDHGKTTLLDTIRKAKVAEGESGGITQHITSYQVKINDRLITFIDTPGHEAFSQMRSRGAGIADIAILIVAADDGVKPQTKEVIKNLKKGEVPVIVAINKIDKEDANPEMVKNQLAEAGLLLEGRGGDIPFVEISAKNNLNIDNLLETVLLSADILELKADFQRRALGIILESHLDQRKGAVATAIIKTGSLNEGDYIIAGNAVGTVRQILDYNDKRIIKAEPASPVVIIGLDKVTKAGSVLQVEESRSAVKAKTKRSNLDSHYLDTEKKADVRKIEGESEEQQVKIPKLNIILKADVEGSVEAINQILSSIPQDEIILNILQSKVGNITENDIQLAKTSNAIVYGFKTMAPDKIKKTAEKNKVKIKIFDIIYKLVEDIKEELSNLLEPEIIRVDLGKLKVLKVFRTEKNKMIVGGRVTSGKVTKNAFFEILRNKELLGEGKVVQLKHLEENVSEVKSGSECGITYAPKEKKSFVRIEENDILKFYLEEAKKRKIE
ncbi:MAG: translation initiation factor IF-2 [Candidatus Moranbacteria bacterium]|nr:translation initiation factor IF-2 [Candidatus Moranbacteria bacterium]